MPVYTNGGSILVDSGSVAVSGDCCCGSGGCCNGSKQVVFDFSFDADDGTQFFSGSGFFTGDISSGCSFSGGMSFPVTVHTHGGPDCSPDANVTCNVIVIYLGGGMWSLDTSVSMGDHSTVCGPSGWPPNSIVASLSTSFSGTSYSGDLLPTTAITMNAHIDVVFPPDPSCPTGACCISGLCSILSEADCNTSSGYYFGDDSVCDPDPCATIGCCITPGRCDTILATDCTGTFIDFGFFCWPEGDVGIGESNCCINGDTKCTGDSAGVFYCCDPMLQVCCGDAGCCPVGTGCCIDGFGNHFCC